MIAKYQWSPDTCDCQFEYQFDENHPDLVGKTFDIPHFNEVPQQFHHLITTVPIKICDIHKNKVDHHNLVKSENLMKNEVHRELSDKLGIKPEEYQWSFDKDRNLVIDKKFESQISAKHKDKIRAV